MLCAALKSRDEQCIVKCVARVRQESVDSALLADFFGRGAVLVPVPASWRYIQGRSWPAERIAVALANSGLGEGPWPVLRRAHAVRKSATSVAAARPSVEAHYESFSVETTATRAATIVLVDDVVTQGRTLLAAAARMREAFPCAGIRGFALLRTQGMTRGVRHLLEPCIGEIAWRYGDADRRP
jgi:predicted amidophosphoribosyltransferase